MKIKSKYRFLSGNLSLLLIMLIITGINTESKSQQITLAVVCSGGETFNASSLSLDFTIGEITTESLSAGSFLLTQGFIQSDESSTGFEENSINEKHLKYYPNPAYEKIYVFYSDKENQPFKVLVNDISGKCILSLDFNTNPLLILLDKLNPGFYTLSLLFDNHQTINKKFIKQ